MSNGDVDEIVRPVREQERRHKRVIAKVKDVAIIAAVGISLFLAYQLRESKDTRDIQSCLVAYTADVGNARAEQNAAIFDGLVRLAANESLEPVAVRKPDIDRAIAKAERRRDLALSESLNDPAAFLRRCRQ
jgi:hypothetical protein